MQATNTLDQQLDGLNRLPTGFFPQALHPTSSVITTPGQQPHHHHHHSRVIVIAYDHSNFGDAMIAKSISLGLIKPTDDIRILNAVSQQDYRNLFAPMLSGNKATLGIHESTMDSHLASAADLMLEEIITCLRKNGFENVNSEIMRGDPKDCIVDYCRMKKPAYLIAGTRGLGAVKRTVMGSVSTYLVRHCPCPVLVCKLDDSEIEARKELNDKKQATFADVLTKFQSKH